MSTDNSNRRAHNFKDLTGQRFGSLVVTGFGKRRGKVIYWSVLCDCGATNLVAGNNLTSGGSKRCGYNCPLRIDPRMKDETGNVYGKWTVTSRAKSKGGAQWNCRCECGTESVISGRDLRAKATTSCGCENVTDEVGNVYGKLTVTEISGEKRDRLHWVCRCECGKTVVVSGTVLRRGDQVSCGCHRASAGGNARKGKQTPEYRSWRKMHDRCDRPGQKGYEIYGGKGVTICKLWRKSFINFLDDMGPKPSDMHSVDRIDGEGNYSCGHCAECLAKGWTANCRWATPQEQMDNSKRSTMLTYYGTTLSIRGWANKLGVSHSAITYRRKQGWDIGQIVAHFSKQQVIH